MEYLRHVEMLVVVKRLIVSLFRLHMICYYRERKKRQRLHPRDGDCVGVETDDSESIKRVDRLEGVRRSLGFRRPDTHNRRQWSAITSIIWPKTFGYATLGHMSYFL